MGKISREKYDKAVAVIGEIMSNCYGAEESGLSDHETERARKGVLEVAEIFDIAVEPPPILPGVTAGEWGYRQQHADVPSTLFVVDVDGKGVIAYHLTEADARLMAASKELVEVLYLLVGSIGNNNKVTDCSPKHAAIELLNKLRVDVGKFRGVK